MKSIKYTKQLEQTEIAQEMQPFRPGSSAVLWCFQASAATSVVAAQDCQLLFATRTSGQNKSWSYDSYAS